MGENAIAELASQVGICPSVVYVVRHDIGKQMREKATATRSRDLTVIKKNLPGLLGINCDAEKPMERCFGFCEEAYGKFICPINLDWNDSWFVLGLLFVLFPH